MGTKFWIKRFLTVLVGGSLLIGAVQWIKTRDLPHALTQGAIWGLASAVIFTVTRIYRSSKGQHCAVCRDTPEMQEVPGDRPDAV